MLKSSPPVGILYDITHDNPSSLDVWNSQAILPLFCALSMANTPIASTRGVDEFLPKQLSVVYDRRLYPIQDKSQLLFINCEAEKVVVTGDFNNWNTEGIEMKQIQKSKWEISLNLSPGKYQYKFIVNGKNWVLGPGPTISDNKGNINNLLSVDECEQSNLGLVRTHINNLRNLYSSDNTRTRAYNDVLIRNVIT